MSSVSIVSEYSGAGCFGHCLEILDLLSKNKGGLGVNSIISAIRPQDRKGVIKTLRILSTASAITSDDDRGKGCLIKKYITKKGIQLLRAKPHYDEIMQAKAQQSKEQNR